MTIYVIMYGLLYILVFMWIDVCGYLCCKKNVYKYTYLYILNNNIIQGRLILSNKKDIWNHCEGITENDLVQKGNYLFTCSRCNYKGDTFKDFIPNFSKTDNYNNNNDTVVNLNISTGLGINNDISIMFFSCDQSIHYSVVCKLTDTFEMVENKLIRENPDLKNKRLFYLFHGQSIIDKQKTLAQLNLKNSDIIIFNEVYI